MKFCQGHWDKLRAAIDQRGLTPLVAKDGRMAMQNTVLELEGRADEAQFDPLMNAHWMIVGRALDLGGMYLMGSTPEGGEYCPVCEVMKHPESCAEPVTAEQIEDYWINGPHVDELDALDRTLVGHVSPWEMPDQSEIRTDPRDIARHVWEKIWTEPREEGHTLEAFTAWFVEHYDGSAPMFQQWRRMHPMPPGKRPAPAYVSDAIWQVMADHPGEDLKVAFVKQEIERIMKRELEFSTIVTATLKRLRDRGHPIRRTGHGFWRYDPPEAREEEAA